MTTRTPAWRSPRAIIIPMPLVPPVTRPCLPLRSKSSAFVANWLFTTVAFLVGRTRPSVDTVASSVVLNEPIGNKAEAPGPRTPRIHSAGRLSQRRQYWYQVGYSLDVFHRIPVWQNIKLGN